ncbi:MAG: hypothetical protein RL385_5404, partial [Pseudomonadota bacterium]
ARDAPERRAGGRRAPSRWPHRRHRHRRTAEAIRRAWAAKLALLRHRPRDEGVEVPICSVWRGLLRYGSTAEGARAEQIGASASAVAECDAVVLVAVIACVGSADDAALGSDQGSTRSGAEVQRRCATPNDTERLSPLCRFERALNLQRSPLALVRVAKKDFGQDQGGARSRAEVRRARTTQSIAGRPSEADQRE